MNFPQEKVLTCSVRDYCDSINRDLGEYELKGVNLVYSAGNDVGVSPAFENLEVIVDAKFVSPVNNLVIGFGTALIPRDK